MVASDAKIDVVGVMYPFLSFLTFFLLRVTRNNSVLGCRRLRRSFRFLLCLSSLLFLSSLLCLSSLLGIILLRARRRSEE